ncbi:hypothetical protein [Paenibacillus agricola]|uniref:HEPN domain-containing protein n=1 Tax=Paenibacillus agricola TaxID=2716264 RepID=A0ABX0JKP8_9BACL|nr:hypothetical protein [Paenibacillus agricola]NHN34500.1 hypothetical protein [Paenibacillus agricola]
MNVKAHEPNQLMGFRFACRFLGSLCLERAEAFAQELCQEALQQAIHSADKVLQQESRKPRIFFVWLVAFTGE